MKLIQGNCLEVMSRATENSIDAIVTDPPYGLKFMGKKWFDKGFAMHWLNYSPAEKEGVPDGKVKIVYTKTTKGN